MPDTRAGRRVPRREPPPSTAAPVPRATPRCHEGANADTSSGVRHMQAELELPSVASAAAAERMAKDAELARQLHGFDVGRSQRARTRTQHFVAQDATADNQEVQALVAADLSRQVGRAAKDPKLSRSAKPYHTGNKDKRRKVAEETNTTQVKGALRAWTDAEVTQLIELVKRDGNDGDWAAKASLLGTGRTASACYSRYYKYTRTRTKAVLPEQQEHGPLLETAKEGASTIAPQRRAVRVAAIRSYNENSMADEAFARAEDAQDCGTTEAAEWRNQRSSPKQPKSRQAAAVSDKAGETNTTQVKGASRAWTDAEVTQLIELVKRDGNDGDWAAKASLLGTGRTASACYARYYKYTRARTKAELPEQQEHGPLLETAKEGASTIAPQRRAVRVAAIRSYNENSMADEAFARAEDAQDCGTTEAAERRNQRSSPKQPKSRQAAAISDKAGKRKGDSVLSCCMMPMCNLVGTKQIYMLPCSHLFCTACIDPWVTEPSRSGRPTCPLCRKSFVSLRNCRIMRTGSLQEQAPISSTYHGPAERKRNLTRASTSMRASVSRQSQSERLQNQPNRINTGGLLDQPVKSSDDAGEDIDECTSEQHIAISSELSPLHRHKKLPRNMPASWRDQGTVSSCRFTDVEGRNQSNLPNWDEQLEPDPILCNTDYVGSNFHAADASNVMDFDEVEEHDAQKDGGDHEERRYQRDGLYDFEIQTEVGPIRPKDCVFVRRDGAHGFFYAARVTKTVPQQGITVRYMKHDTASFNSFTETLLLAEITQNRVRFECNVADIGWTWDEENKLIRLIDTIGRGNWVDIAQQLGTFRTADACSSWYQKCQNHWTMRTGSLQEQVPFSSTYHGSAQRKRNLTRASTSMRASVSRQPQSERLQNQPKRINTGGLLDQPVKSSDDAGEDIDECTSEQHIAISSELSPLHRHKKLPRNMPASWRDQGTVSSCRFTDVEGRNQSNLPNWDEQLEPDPILCNTDYEAAATSWYQKYQKKRQQPALAMADNISLIDKAWEQRIGRTSHSAVKTQDHIKKRPVQQTELLPQPERPADNERLAWNGSADNPVPAASQRQHPKSIAEKCRHSGPAVSQQQHQKSSCDKRQLSTSAAGGTSGTKRSKPSPRPVHRARQNAPLRRNTRNQGCVPTCPGCAGKHKAHTCGKCRRHTTVSMRGCPGCDGKHKAHTCGRANNNKTVAKISSAVKSRT